MASVAADATAMSDVTLTPSVDTTIRMSSSVKNADYWNVFFENNEKFYKQLPEKGINFPFPQMDVHVKNN